MIKELFHTADSCFRMALHGHVPSCFRPGVTGEGKCLRVLGNGKSLLRDVFVPSADTDYMVVNMHVLSDTYQEIRPLYYVLADPFFFSNPAGLDILERINERTAWKMYLCLPYSHRYNGRRKRSITNPHVSLQFYNACGFEGFKRIAYYLYSRQLAMPVVQNVLVACIMLGIRMKYPRIELYGTEHTWTRYLSVGEDNLVYLEDPHFYDKEKVRPRPWKDNLSTGEYPFYLILKQYSRMFQSYWEIRDYVGHAGLPVKIVNRTKGSYIDAFERG